MLQEEYIDVPYWNIKKKKKKDMTSLKKKKMRKLFLISFAKHRLEKATRKHYPLISLYGFRVRSRG